MGTGAVVSILSKFVHPSKEVRDKYPVRAPTHRLEGCIVVREAIKTINRREQSSIVFTHDDFPNVALYACSKHLKIVEEGPESAFFNREESNNQQRSRSANVNNEEEEEVPFSADVVRMMESVRLGGAVGDEELLTRRDEIEIDDDRDPLPENLMPVQGAENECHFSEAWGHNGLCHRRVASGGRKTEPKLHLEPGAQIGKLELFETLFMKNYIVNVLLILINENIKGESVAYGEFLLWLGLWFLMATVVGPSRDAFFSDRLCDEFADAPFRLTKYMSRKRFNQILVAMRYTNKDPPSYKDRFFEVRQMLDAWNLNMTEVFEAGWATCLDESMSPWTNKYTCPGFVWIPRKPWPYGNEYHTICCCTSGILFAQELVEGRDRPKEKQEEYSEFKGATTGLLLRLCKSFFHMAKIVVLDSGFCVLRALVELRKRGVFAHALIKKRKYWPKYIKGDEIKAHFQGREVGTADAISGTLDQVPFHVFAMKEPDYTMMVMSTYGTNERNDRHRTQRIYKENGEIKKTHFSYPEVMSNYFRFRHSVDDHNGRRHAPISLEYVWATKWWPNRVFSFLLAVTEVNVNLAKSYFITKDAPKPQLEFRRLLAKALINNKYILHDKAAVGIRRSPRGQHLTSHNLVKLPPYRKFKGCRIVKSKSQYPQATCEMGHRKIRTYCSCSPGILRCDQCFVLHCMEEENAAARSD